MPLWRRSMRQDRSCYTALTWGGSGEDVGNDISVDGLGNAYVTGFTNSLNFPVTPGAFQRTFQGDPADAFVTKINAAGTAFVYSTYLGGTGDNEGNGIAVDAQGNAYVSGFTNATDFPVTPGAFQTSYQGGPHDAFVTKLDLLPIPPLTITRSPDITVFNDPGSSGAIVNYPPPTVSGGNPGVTIDCSPPSGSFFGPGNTTVTCTATDAAGNTSTCSFNVKVIIDPCRFLSCRRRF